MPRQIIIEIGDDGKSIVLRKDETASVFERSAILSGIAQAQQDIPVIPQGEKVLPTNNNQNGEPRPTSGGNSAKRNKSSESGK